MCLCMCGRVCLCARVVSMYVRVYAVLRFGPWGSEAQTILKRPGHPTCCKGARFRDQGPKVMEGCSIPRSEAPKCCRVARFGNSGRQSVVGLLHFEAEGAKVLYLPAKVQSSRLPRSSLVAPQHCVCVRWCVRVCMCASVYIYIYIYTDVCV